MNWPFRTAAMMGSSPTFGRVVLSVCRTLPQFRCAPARIGEGLGRGGGVAFFWLVSQDRDCRNKKKATGAATNVIIHDGIHHGASRAACRRYLTGEDAISVFRTPSKIGHAHLGVYSVAHRSPILVSAIISRFPSVSTSDPLAGRHTSLRKLRTDCLSQNSRCRLAG